MKNFLTAIAVSVTLVAITTTAQAGNPTGNWKSTITLNNQTMETELKLKLDSEGNILSGFELVGSRQQLALSRTTFKDNKISFSNTHEMGGRATNVTYSGRLKGDQITGKCVIDLEDGAQTTAWTATRQRPQ